MVRQKNGGIKVSGDRARCSIRLPVNLPVLLAIAPLVIVSHLIAADAHTNASFGIEERVPWTTSRMTGAPDPPAPYRTERVFPRLTFTDPVTLTRAPGSSRLFVVELSGKIHSFRNEDDCADTELMIDLAKSQRADRVYGFTFHPDYPKNPHCYVCYTVGQDIEHGTKVSEFEVIPSDPPRIDASSERTLITWLSGGHNGGCLKFGHDGYLYISTGDGGPAFPPDPLKSGQDVSNVLSSILRIDVDHVDGALPYSIPATNPFVNLDDARGEVWAYGFRNPWRMSFDSVTGDLWVGDVGWELWEMVYRVTRGANYGWSLMEGPQAVHRERLRGPTPISEPTVSHSHIESRSVTGGFVYRGARLPDLRGWYIYGDYVTGKIWAVHTAGGKPKELADTALAIICFGIDHEEELYLVGYDGTIHQLRANPTQEVNQSFPRRLSETGLFLSVPDHSMAPGVIPYSINAEPWMDGATAQRYLAIPGDAALGLYPENRPQVGTLAGHWAYPNDSVLVKTISLQTDPARGGSPRRLETQVLHFNVDQWNAYNYIWNDEQTDAVLADDASSTTEILIRDPRSPSGERRQTWHFASRTQCILCHTSRGGTIYGFTPAQLNRDHQYDAAADNQLRTMKHIGLFEVQQKSRHDRIVDPYDTAADLERRARAYLHVNCAHCHRRGGGGTAHIELLYDWSIEQTHLLDARPTQGTFGIHGAEVLARGDPYRSVLYYRMAKLGRGRMPYVGSSVIDQRGVQLLHDWITQLGPGGDFGAGVARKEQRDALQNLYSGDTNPASSSETIATLLSSTSGALMLLTSLADRPPDDSLTQQIIATGTAHADLQIRDLFETYVPEESRIQRLGTAVDPGEILALAGNAERGATLFREAAGVQCRNCHRIGEFGKALGPDLDRLPNPPTRRTLLEAILEPSKDIDPKYLAQLVETAQGKVFVGLVRQENKDELILKDAQNEEIRIATGDIEFQAPQQKSLMPELLIQDMTAQELADLLAYLMVSQTATSHDN